MAVIIIITIMIYLPSLSSEMLANMFFLQKHGEKL